MKRYFLLAVLLLSNIPVLLADDGPPLPCGGTSSPDDPVDCPIDTWVIAFAAFMLIATTLYLYKKQKALLKPASNNII